MWIEDRKGTTGALCASTDEGMTEDVSGPLLRRCRRRDSAALSEIISLHERRLYRLALGVLGNPAAAEDAVARAFVAIWTHAGQWRGEAAAATWIHRIAVRKIIDVARSERRWTMRLFGRRSEGELGRVPDPRPGPDRETEDRESRGLRRKRVGEALARLKEDDRVLVHLFYFEGLALSEIEGILDVPKTNLKMRLARAREKLRKLLGGATAHET